MNIIPNPDPLPGGLELDLREGSVSCQVVGLSESHFPPCRLGAKKRNIQIEKEPKTEGQQQ